MKRIFKFIRIIKKFLRANFSIKLMAIEALFLAAIYRFLILNIEFKNLNKRLGEKGRELSLDGDKSGYILAKKISLVVNKVCDITPWESKCLVRAMVAQRMMKRRGYRTTLYLGVGKDSRGMNAHAWIRYGNFFITGGNGEGFARVAILGN